MSTDDPSPPSALAKSLKQGFKSVMHTSPGGRKSQNEKNERQGCVEA